LQGCFYRFLPCCHPLLAQSLPNLSAGHLPIKTNCVKCSVLSLINLSGMSCS
jgi:hypothetical protein